MLGPMVVVVAGLTTAAVAVRTQDALVNRRLLQTRQREINAELTRDNEAVRLKMAQVMFGEGGRDVRVMLQKRWPLRRTKVRLLMLHPTLSDRDQQVELVKSGEGWVTSAS